jgi:site-specific DNA-methyltransferase (adenine-specific)
MEINKVYNGDCLELLKKLDDNSVDLIITSPPYSDIKGYKDFNGIHPDNYCDWFLPIISEISRVMKPSGSFILNINDKVVDRFRHPYVFDLISRISKETDLKMFERLFWNKLKGLPNRSRFSDRIEFVFWFVKSKDFYFDIDKFRQPYSEKSIKRMKKPLKKRFARTEENSSSGEYKEWKPNPLGALPTTLINISSESKRISDNHVAVYPLEFAQYFIEGSSKPGDLVLDPFMGTGTTGIACKVLGRNWLGFDLIEEYVEFANNRISNFNI